VHYVAALKFDEHLMLQCDHGSATRLFDLHCDCLVEASSDAQEQFLIDSAMPGKKAFGLRYMYLLNATLEFAQSGKTPPGMTITERRAGDPATQTCDDWFIGDGMKFDADNLLLQEGDEVVDLGDGASTSRPASWQPLNPQTWSIWWNALNARYNLPQVFGGARR
jgi:hypothetical protein